MQLQIDKLGKVSITVEQDYWDINKEYDKLTIVEKKDTFSTFISRKPVPAGIALTNRTYWITFSSIQEHIMLDYNSFIAKYAEALKQVEKDITIIESELSNITKELNSIKEDYLASDDFTVVDDKLTINKISESELDSILV